jgi:hypothetical protein
MILIELKWFWLIKSNCMSIFLMEVLLNIHELITVLFSTLFFITIYTLIKVMLMGGNIYFSILQMFLFSFTLIISIFVLVFQLVMNSIWVTIQWHWKLRLSLSLLRGLMVLMYCLLTKYGHSLLSTAFMTVFYNVIFVKSSIGNPIALCQWQFGFYWAFVWTANNNIYNAYNIIIYDLYNIISIFVKKYKFGLDNINLMNCYKK